MLTISYQFDLQYYVKYGIIISDVGITLHNNLILNGQYIAKSERTERFYYEDQQQL